MQHKSRTYLLFSITVMNYNNYWRLLACLLHAKERAEQTMHPFCADAGITPTQLRVMMALHFEGPQTTGTLARQSCMAMGNLSTLCKKLEAGGMVHRRRDPQDERLVRVSLTEQGEEIILAFLRQCEGHLASWSRRVPPEDMQAIEAGLERLVQLLETRSPQ